MFAQMKQDESQIQNDSGFIFQRLKIDLELKKHNMKQIKANELKQHKILQKKFLKHLKTRQYFEIKSFLNLRFKLNQYVMINQFRWLEKVSSLNSAYFLNSKNEKPSTFVYDMQDSQDLVEQIVLQKYQNFNENFLLPLRQIKLPKILRDECFKIKKIMKSTKEVINDVIKKLSQRQKNETQPSSDDNEAELTAFDLIPIHFTGMIQDYLFRQSQEIFDILKEDNHHDIQGISFDEIRGDMAKNLYYEKVKENIPKYYALKAGKRQKHFKQEGQLYLKKLAIETKHIQPQNYPETEKKNLAKARQQTPMKLNKMSKKEAKQQKKQQKKINCIKKPKDENQQSQQEREQVKDKVFVTPKKQIQNKQVKFFQFEFVKDFSQFKTPKRLSCVQQVLEPLKQVQQIHNSEQ